MNPYERIAHLREKIKLARESHPAKIGKLEKINASLNIAVKDVPTGCAGAWKNIYNFFIERMNAEVYKTATAVKRIKNSLM